ncbi:S1C family serine protease [Patescibacteria group bacterium]
MTSNQKTIFSGFVSGVFGAIIIAVLCLGVIFYSNYDFNGFITTTKSLINNSKDQTESITIKAIDVSDVVAQVNPAVVSIVITEEVPVIETYYEDPFNDFFGGQSPFSFQIPRYRQNGTEQKEVGGGSGFLISQDGYLVTNAHVIIDEEAEYTVFLNDETSHKGEVVALDKTLDVALMKIEGDDFPFLEFADSEAIRLGQGVIAIGNALGEFRNTVSTGVVSGLARSITAGNGYSAPESLENVIQTDAAINPGNSGGPLLNFAGKVIGVNVAVARGSENIGFSLPANAIRTSVESMKEHGRVIRPYLGIRFIPITESVKEKNNLKVDYGVLILRGESRDELAVLPGSPADKAGLEEYDIILELDGQKIDEEHSLPSIIRSKQVGDKVELKIIDNGDEKTISITLDENPL